MFCRLVYLLASFIKRTDPDKAVFVTSRSKQLEGNLEFVYNELQKNIPKSKIHLVVTNNKMNLSLLKEVIKFSNAKYLIIDDYYLPIYLIKPNKDLKIIQLWHAAGAFKKFGHSTIGTKFGPNQDYLKIIPIHKNYTHVYVSSQNVVSHYAEAFDMCEENIYPLGTPRTDLFTNTELKNKTIKSLIDKNSFIKSNAVHILIAPTYRADGPYEESNFNILQTLAEIAVELDKGIQILFKPHPYMCTTDVNKLDNYNNINIVSDFSINEWMLISDAFITDYSSSIFDYALLKRPIAHYVPDIDDYIRNRGLYYNITDISDGEIIKDRNTLLNWMNSREKNEEYDTSHMVNFNFDHTKDVSKLVVNHFISK